jgi:hypothetical protein
MGLEPCGVSRDTHPHLHTLAGRRRARLRLLKDPLFLASSVFLKKPERIVALSCVMVLCLLVYGLAEYRVRQQLAATG